VKDKKTALDHIIAITPVVIVGGILIVGAVFGELARAIDAVCVVLIIWWASAVKSALESINDKLDSLELINDRLESIEHDLNRFPYSDRQKALLNKDASKLTDKDWAVLDPPSIKETLDSITHTLESIESDFSGDWSGNLTEKEEEERYERSVQGRLQSIEHALESMKRPIEDRDRPA
jgi:hypothetical protein